MVSRAHDSSACLPSDDNEAPDSLNSSEPICIGNTLPAGSISRPPGDSCTLLGVETSMTLPSGPVPLLCSFRRSTCGLSCEACCGTPSLGAGGAARVVGGGRASAGAARTGEATDASDDCRDLFWRFDGFSTVVFPLCETELDSESSFLFIPVWTTGCGRGGGGDNGLCVCVVFGVGVAL
jgi:hypothetical protein